MAPNRDLILAIAVLVLAVLAMRFLAWRVVSAAAFHAPGIVPRLAASRFWTRGAGLRDRWATRFPGISEAVANRFRTDAFTGLPLTLMTIAAIYVLAILSGLVELIHSHHGTVQLDQTIDDAFSPYRTPWLLKSFQWITAIGAGPSLAIVLLTATALLWSDRRLGMAIPLWITFLGAQATTWSSKYVIARPRPAFLPGITEWNPSFPSGHATATTALFGMLGYIVAANLPSLRARFEVTFWTMMIVATICFSRLFLGVHFFTDVTAGILVGVFWILVGYTVAALRRQRHGMRI